MTGRFMCSIEKGKKISYLFLSSDKFPPFRVDVSILFGKELGKKNHQIAFVLQSEKNCKKAYLTNWSGCRIYVGKMDNGLTLSRRIRKNIFRFINDIKCVKLILNPQISGIIIKDKFFAASIVALFTRLINKKCVFWLSFPFPESNIYSARNKMVKYPYPYFLRGLIFKFLLYRCLLPLSHHIFAQSEQMKKDLKKKGVKNVKITAVPMGVEIKDFDSQWFYSNVKMENGPNIIYLGALDRIRKIDFILRVFQKVLLKEKETTLWLVGDSENPEDVYFLRKEAQRLGIQNSVKFTGFLRREKALAYLLKADVCLSPFYPTPVLNSTSPTKIIEYMAMGKPVVANQHPEQSLIIKESRAGICVPYNEDDFSKAIIFLINNPQERTKMGLRGRKYVEKYRSYSTIAEQVDSRLRQIFKI